MSSKERRDDSFIKKPVYPGGPVAYRKFIKENLKYPKTALKNKTEGTVHLKYTIDHLGKVVDTKVIKSVGHGCDEEAQRLVKLLQFEVPKSPRKLRVQFHQKTQITFRLPKVKKVASPPKTSKNAQLVYQYKAKSKAVEQAENPKKSYNYTIRIK